MAQESVTLSGTISEADNGESLIGATVFVVAEGTGASSNEYGFYSIEIPANSPVQIQFSYVGLQTLDTTITIGGDTQMDVSLVAEGILIDEVVVVSNSEKERITSAQTSVEVISTAEARVLPAILGEVDIIKTLQLKPGISSGSEGSSSLYVRGGNGDQNLILLDEATVYNANHLFGFFSTFNADGVKDVKIYKGGFPAQYGGRLSSVIDVRLKDGNLKKFSGTGGIGAISSRLTLEGPIKEDKISYIVSGRRTYVDIATDIINRSRSDDPDWNPIPGYNFYDLNTKINAQIDDKNRVFLSGYFGRDQFKFDDDNFDFNFNWGNATGTVRWNHQFSSKLFSNTTGIFSDYQYNITNELTGFSFNLSSAIRDFSLKQDFYYALNNNHQIRSGGQITYHEFKVGRLQAGSDDGEVAFSSGLDLTSTEGALFINDDFRINDKINGVLGLRASFFTDDKTYINWEPRIALNYLLTDDLSIKTSYARMAQNVHLVSNSGLSLPTDIWYPSTNNVKSQLSDQVVVGYQWNFADGWIFTNELYYKWMYNQIQFKDHAELFANDNLEEEFVFGKGIAQGIEFGVEKNKGPLTGWIGYTLAKVDLFDFADIQGGEKFQPSYDRRHDLSIVLIYQINDRWSVSGTYVYGSGDLTWLPTGKYILQDVNNGAFSGVVPVYGDRNNVRIPSYSRMDLGAVFRFGKNKNQDLTFSVINALNRRNPYFLYLDVETETVRGDGFEVEVPTNVRAKQVSLFPILPALTWNFKF